MDKKYKNYSTEDFTQDLEFINWVKRGTEQKQWENFVRENPTQSKNIHTAKKIVSMLQIDSNNSEEHDIYEVYRKIETFHELHYKSKQKIRFRKIMQYAALFILILSIGAAIPIFYFTKNNNRFSDIAVSSSGIIEAKLILSDGEEILLKEQNSDLQFNTLGTQIKIDQDSIVDYKAKTDKNAMAQVVIPFGKRSNILLSDGTKVWLNAGSKLIFPQKFTGKTRKVFLKGEAYFDVSKNERVPFIVSTDNINVTVQGTEFNVKDNSSDKNLEIVLVEGEVSLKGNSVMNFLNEEIKLSPNQLAIFNKLDNKVAVHSNVDADYYTSWKEGLLKFNRESILVVFEGLSRYYNVRFVTENSVELNRKFSGKLDLKESLEDVMKVIADAAPITFRIEKDKVYVSSKINYLPVR